MRFGFFVVIVVYGLLVLWCVDGRLIFLWLVLFLILDLMVLVI